MRTLLTAIGAAITEGRPALRRICDAQHTGGGVSDQCQRAMPSTSGPAALGGYPTVSLPFGYGWGLPVGLSFMGSRTGVSPG